MVSTCRTAGCTASYCATCTRDWHKAHPERNACPACGTDGFIAVAARRPPRRGARRAWACAWYMECACTLCTVPFRCRTRRSR